MQTVEAFERLDGPAARSAQECWAREPIGMRLVVLRRARHGMAHRVGEFCAAISPALARSAADTRVAEVLPLLDACRFLERRAAAILATRRLGRRGLPLWLAGVDSEVQRAAFGQILVIGPANYPLFLPGVQTLQALAAGNAVVWKPGRGGRAVAEIFAAAMYAAGLPRELLVVTEDSIAVGQEALAGRVNGVAPDKVVFTGSAESGREILRALAATGTPCVAELSGCDAVVVLASANLPRVAKALAFGMRLNGSATCMAPRRLFLIGMAATRRDELIGMLRSEFAGVGGVLVADSVHARVSALLEEARGDGAAIFDLEDVGSAGLRPVLVTHSNASMRIARANVFAPVLSVIEVADEAELLAVDGQCPYGLTAAIFGEERAARRLAAKMAVGTVVINDVIVPTVDPRVPFGGRRGSGFGATRGAQGLLEMTAAKTVAVRRGKSVRHYEAAGQKHEALFDGLIRAAHAGAWRDRWRGLKQIVSAVRKFK